MSKGTPSGPLPKPSQSPKPSNTPSGGRESTQDPRTK